MNYYKTEKDIRKIIVRVVNYENIYYSVKCYDGTIEEYTEQTVPNSIIKLINWNTPIFKGKTGEHETTMIYRFN